MAKVVGLVRKKSIFFYVRRIPETIKATFGNKTQLTIPLQTSDPRIAASRAKAKAAEVDIAFQKAKLGLKPEMPGVSPKVSLAQLETAALLHPYERELASRGSVRRSAVKWVKLVRMFRRLEIQNDESAVSALAT